MNQSIRILIVVLVILGGAYFLGFLPQASFFEKKTGADKASFYVDIEQLVRDHAYAWETGDLELLKETIHEDIIFAYPGRRLDYGALIEDFEYYRDNFSDTKVYINTIIQDGNNVAVEWQFAYTDNATGKRLSVSDGIIGEVMDGKIVLWKEYLDGRVSRMQQVDALPLEEGQESFPSPMGSLRNFCEVTVQ